MPPTDRQLRVTVTDALFVFPAASIAVAVIVFWPQLRLTLVENEPALTGVALPFTVRPARPESRSPAVPVTVTDAVETVLLFAGEVIATDGLSLSTFTTKLTEL